MSELPNPLVPPFPPANLKAVGRRSQGKAARTQTPREPNTSPQSRLLPDYDKVDHKTAAEHYEEAMQRLHEHYPDDAEAAIFYALALNAAVDFDDKNFTKQASRPRDTERRSEKAARSPALHII